MDQHEEFRSSKMVKVTLKFTPEELLERVHELDDARRTRESLDDQRKKAGKDYRTAATHCEVLSAEICTGEGEREVEADEVFIFATNSVETRRRDTGEVLEVRPMTPAERQPNLFLVDGGEAVNRETGEIATVHNLSDRAEKARQKRLKKEASDTLDAHARIENLVDFLTGDAPPADIAAEEQGSLIDASFPDLAEDDAGTSDAELADIVDPAAILADDAGVDAPEPPKKAKRSHKKKASK